MIFCLASKQTVTSTYSNFQRTGITSFVFVTCLISRDIRNLRLQRVLNSSGQRKARSSQGECLVSYVSSAVMNARTAGLLKQTSWRNYSESRNVSLLSSEYMHYAVQPLCKALVKESKQKCHPYRLYLGYILPFSCLITVPTIYQIE